MREKIAKWRQRHMTPWRWVLTGILIFEISWLLAPPPHAFVEYWYSLRFYPLVSRAIVALQDAAPVPLSAILLLTAVVAIGIWGIREWRSLGAARRSRWWLGPRLASVSAQGLVVFLMWALVVWGAGYQRMPVEARWLLDDTDLSAEESRQLQEELLAIIHENAGAAESGSRTEAVEAIATSMEQFLRERGDGPVGVPRQVRRTPPGLFLAFSTAGMCVPGAIEPFADGAYDDVSFVQVAAHELAHVAGYNRESEATLVGYLAGLRADNAFSRYAVSLAIYMDLIGRLREKDARTAAWEALPERAREDYKRGRDIASRYRIKVEKLQQARHRAYDSYLKSQGIGEGEANYSAGLRLFSGAWRKGLADMKPQRGPSEG